MNSSIFQLFDKARLRLLDITVFGGVVCASAALIAGAAAHSHHRHHGEREARESRDKKTKAPEPAPQGPFFLVVSTGKQHVSVYNGGGLVARGSVSTGRPDHPTPHGIFSILEKERYHTSNIYSGAPMPWMERITWSGVAMHAGVMPGYPASHGCIRMSTEFAKRLYGMTKGGERVVVSREDILPASIESPRLPEPKLHEAPAIEANASAPSHAAQSAFAVNAAATRAASSGSAVDVSADPGEPAQSQRLLNPVEFAKIMKRVAQAKDVEAAKAVKDAHSAAAITVEAANTARTELRRADAAAADLQDRVDGFERKLERTESEGTAQEASAAKAAAQFLLKDAEARVEAAYRAHDEKTETAWQALKAAKQAELLKKVAAEDLKSWNRRLDPVSIFISGKTSHLYVRQGFVKVFDIPVTIRDPQTPLGTHLYMAMQPEKDDSALHWLVLSIPGASREEPRRHHGRHGRGHDAEDVEAQPAPSPSSAEEALDRIDIPERAQARISDMLWTGASLIVSDNGMSGETGPNDTDFIILTR